VERTLEAESIEENNITEFATLQEWKLSGKDAGNTHRVAKMPEPHCRGQKTSYVGKRQQCSLQSWRKMARSITSIDA
jgi:hypothetical protein